MKFLLWDIKVEPSRLAKVQWLLFKLFGIKQKKNACGSTKSSFGHYCRQPSDLKHCEVFKEGKFYRVKCKCCGHCHISSSEYIDPNDDSKWIKF